MHRHTKTCGLADLLFLLSLFAMRRSSFCVVTLSVNQLARPSNLVLLTSLSSITSLHFTSNLAMKTSDSYFFLAFPHSRVHISVISAHPSEEVFGFCVFEWE